MSKNIKARRESQTIKSGPKDTFFIKARSIQFFMTPRQLLPSFQAKNYATISLSQRNSSSLPSMICAISGIAATLEDMVTSIISFYDLCYFRISTDFYVRAWGMV